MQLLPFIFTLAIMTSALAGEQAATTDALFGKADELAAQGDFDAAVAAVEEVVAGQPDSSLAHQRLGGMLLLKGDYGRAIDSFRTAIGLDEANGRAFIGMGMAYIHMGSYTLARASFDEALGRQPELADEINQVTAWLDARDGRMSGDKDHRHAGEPHPSAAKQELSGPASPDQAPATAAE